MADPMETIIVFANQGKVRPVRFREAGLDPQDQAHLSEIPGAAMEQKTEPVREVVTDSAGQFPGGGTGAMSNGEEHNLETELKTRNLQRIAQQISEVVHREGNPPWRLVAPAEILPSLRQSLSAEAGQSLHRTEAGDLTKVPLAALEQRYLAAS